MSESLFSFKSVEALSILRCLPSSRGKMGEVEGKELGEVERK